MDRILKLAITGAFCLSFSSICSADENFYVPRYLPISQDAGTTTASGGADSDTEAEASNAEEEVLTKKETEELIDRKISEGSRNFWDYFGVGAGATYFLADEAQRVEEAFLDENGIVRVNRDTRANVGFFLEAHVLRRGWCPTAFFRKNVDNNKPGGCGPFVIAQPSSDEIIDALGFGYMVQAYGASNNRPGVSMNLGLGVLIDPNTEELRSQLRVDEPLPDMFDASIGLTQSVSRTQLVFIVSFSG
ncbi:MAG: hypothetical protein AAGJ29_03870 [Pseudomonadota bacterium]